MGQTDLQPGVIAMLKLGPSGSFGEQKPRIRKEDIRDGTHVDVLLGEAMRLRVFDTPL